MAFQEIKVPDNATIAQKGLAWVDSRFPLTKLFKEHMSEYYAPKNFNFWYFFGALAIVVLAIQIVTGIFLVMNYKPDAAKAFDSFYFLVVNGGSILWLSSALGTNVILGRAGDC